MFGTKANPEGITNPPIDELIEKVDSKYALVIYAAKRARQINSYYQSIGVGQLGSIGPLLDKAELDAEPGREPGQEDKPLSLALREINADLLTSTRLSE